MDIDIPTLNEFYKRQLLGKEGFPCHCKIGKQFEIDFIGALHIDTKGFINEWDQSQIDKLAPALGGGEYCHDCPALITIEEDSEKYIIKNLSFFNTHLGWCEIIKDYNYVS